MGLQAQRKQVEAFAQRERFDLLETVDESASAAVREGEFSSIEHRPALSRLLTRAEAREYEVLVVASLDRLSRDQIDSQLLKRWFAKFNVRVESAAGETNGGENGIFGELVDRILGAIHDFDRKRILERVRAGKAEGRAEGRHVEGRIPYGYRSVVTTTPGTKRSRRTLVINETAARIVARIFEAISAGRSPGEIARSLNAESVAAPQARQTNEQSDSLWTGNGVRSIVRNRVYVGERHGVKGVHRPIVSTRKFNAANRALEARAHEWAQRRRGGT